MDSKAVEIVRKGLKSFSPTIRFFTHGDPHIVLEQAIAQEPRILYYLHAPLLYGASNHYELRAQYIHKDTEWSDIQIVSSIAECEDLLCHFAGKYRNRLIVIAKSNIGMNKVVESFVEKYGTFYSNLISVKSSSYHSNSVYAVYEFLLDYRIGRVKLAQMEQDVNSEISKLAKKLFIPGLSSEAKIYLAHNYLVTSVEYVNSNKNKLDLSYTQSAYGALIKKQCVCQGYAEAFKRIMDYCGIECYVIYGRTTGSSSLHAWNIVSLGNGGAYYHIDVTWDAAGERPMYTYFCKNDSFFVGKRSWNREYNKKCNGSYPVLAVARKMVIQNKTKLMQSGVSSEILDC